MAAYLDKISDTLCCQSSAWEKSDGENGEEDQLRNVRNLTHHVVELVCIGFRYFKKLKGSTFKKRLKLVTANG